MRLVINALTAAIPFAGLVAWLSPPWYGAGALALVCWWQADAWVETWWPFG